MLRGLEPVVVELGNGITESDLLVHDAFATSTTLAYILSRLKHPSILGILRDVERPTYADGVLGQVKLARAKKGVGDLATLYRDSDIWEVK